MCGGASNNYDSDVFAKDTFDGQVKFLIRGGERDMRFN